MSDSEGTDSSSTALPAGDEPEEEDQEEEDDNRDDEDDDDEDLNGIPCSITEDWLARALADYHRGAEVRVRKLDVRPGCGAGQAALSDILAVSTKYALREGPDAEETQCSARLVVKLPPRDPFCRYFVAEAQFDLREIKFYTEVVPDLQNVKVAEGNAPVTLPVPKCYYAHYKQGKADPGESPQPPESALVLEDIRPLGYRTADFSEGLTFKQAEAAMDAVARVHALSLVLAVRSPTPLSEKYPFLFQSERASDSYQQLLERGLPQLSRFLEDRPALAGIQNSLEALRPRTRQLIEALLRPAPPMAVITHTDFWCNNLMFREVDGNTECCILDWQMVTLSRPTNDIALLVVSSVGGELRREREQQLLDTYFNRVTSACEALGEDIVGLGWSKALLKREHRRSRLLALLLCLGSVDVALGDARAETRLEDALTDARDQGLLDEEFIQEQLEKA